MSQNVTTSRTDPLARRQIAFRASLHLIEDARRAALALDRSLSSLCRIALEAYLEGLEDEPHLIHGNQPTKGH